MRFMRCQTLTLNKNETKHENFSKFQGNIDQVVEIQFEKFDQDL